MLLYVRLQKKKKIHLGFDFVESLAVKRKQQSKELEWWMTVPIMVNNHTVGLCAKFCHVKKVAIKGGA